MHLARFEDSVGELYHRRLPAFLEARIFAEAARSVPARPAGDGGAARRRSGVRAVEREPARIACGCAGGAARRAGTAQWSDRRLVDELGRRGGGVPLLVDLDGHVLEAGYANRCVVEGIQLATPPLGVGASRPGTCRRAPAAARLRPSSRPAPSRSRSTRLSGGGRAVLTSSVRGVHPATLSTGPARFDTGARVRATLYENELAAAAR